MFINQLPVLIIEMSNYTATKQSQLGELTLAVS